jgi:hypothetical protein
LKQNASARYPRAYLSPFTLNQLHLKNPYVVAIWSFISPGLGNLLQNRILKGLILILWQLFINTRAKINLAILYSFKGDFEMAKHVVNKRWLLLYIAVYMYSAWDAYRVTVDINNCQFLLTGRMPLSHLLRSRLGI